jgi:hypothetical protein
MRKVLDYFCHVSRIETRALEWKGRLTDGGAVGL